MRDDLGVLAVEAEVGFQRGFRLVADNLLSQLSGLVDIYTTEAPNGAVSVSMGGAGGPAGVSPLDVISKIASGGFDKSLLRGDDPRIRSTICSSVLESSE